VGVGGGEVRALVVTAPGTNREMEVVRALEAARATPEICPTELLAERLPHAALVVLAGGFSHADALDAGRRWALTLRSVVGDALEAHVAQGRALLGICNGFQALVRYGLLPGALGRNADGRFVCRWVQLEVAPGSGCVWTSGLDGPIDCVVAHGEGRYVVDPDAKPTVALNYRDNPNGSDYGIAGVTDATGLVLGLMPHPEDHVSPLMHPRRRRPAHERGQLGLGIFEAGVRHARTA
jgi:phosphoribosylformylglycinamidine synthase I